MKRTLVTRQDKERIFKEAEQPILEGRIFDRRTLGKTPIKELLLKFGDMADAMFNYDLTEKDILRVRRYYVAVGEEIIRRAKKTPSQMVKEEEERLGVSVDTIGTGEEYNY